MERRQLLQRRWPGNRAPVPGASPAGGAGTRRRGAAGHRALDPSTVNAETIQVVTVKEDSNRIKGARIEVTRIRIRITRLQKQGHRLLTQDRI